LFCGEAAHFDAACRAFVIMALDLDDNNLEQDSKSFFAKCVCATRSRAFSSEVDTGARREPKVRVSEYATKHDKTKV